MASPVECKTADTLATTKSVQHDPFQDKDPWTKDEWSIMPGQFGALKPIGAIAPAPSTKGKPANRFLPLAREEAPDSDKAREPEITEEEILELMQEYREMEDELQELKAATSDSPSCSDNEQPKCSCCPHPVKGTGKASKNRVGKGIRWTPTLQALEDKKAGAKHTLQCLGMLPAESGF